MKLLMSLIIALSTVTAFAQTEATTTTPAPETAESVGTIKKTTDAEQKEAHKAVKTKKHKAKKHKSKHKKSHK